MRTSLLIIAVAGLLAPAGCGSSNGGGAGPRSTTTGHKAAPEASPEAPAHGPAASGDAADADRAEATATVIAYITALDHREAAAVCAVFAPGALDLGELPRRRGGCQPSLRASIGHRPARGAPAWRRTTLHETKVAGLGDDRMRVTATVTHRFSDRRYVSVEDDVIYLERVGGRWLLAKPSGTLYRAVGYPEPPLRSLTPPPGWV